MIFFINGTQQGDASQAALWYPFLGRTGRPFRDPKVKTPPLFAAGSTSPHSAVNKIAAPHGRYRRFSCSLFGIVAMISDKLTNGLYRPAERGSSELIGQQPSIRPTNQGLLSRLNFAYARLVVLRRPGAES